MCAELFQLTLGAVMELTQLSCDRMKTGMKP